MMAMVQKRYLELPLPGEEDKQADLDRLCRALEPEFGRVRIDYKVLAESINVIREAQYQVTAVLGWCNQWHLLGIQPGDTTEKRYAFACDLGSTTIAVQLLDLNKGKALDTQTAVNAQVKLGTDILTRIFYTREPGLEREHRSEMQKLAVQTIDDLIDGLLKKTGVCSEDAPMLMISGNTTMTHFLLGVDAFCVFSTPFAPAFNEVPPIWGRELGFYYSGMVCCMPSAANYLGGDIVSGIYSTELMEQDTLSLFVDIGTNGEMALGCRDFLIAGAGAAGPALEGGISEYGMRAAPGAVHAVKIVSSEDQIQISVIGDQAPMGICGSGIVDLLAELFRNGWMDSSGRLLEGTSCHIRPVGHGDRPDELAVFYAEKSGQGCPLAFTQTDILQFTDTKAAAHTMVACLLGSAGVEPSQLENIFLAGGFGEHVNLESAITIGMYPDLSRERFRSIGNSSLSGAVKLLLNREGFQSIRRILETVYYLEFAMQPDFLDQMRAAKFYPHTNMDLYPSVKAQRDFGRHK